MSNDRQFRRMAPIIMRDLMKDFPVWGVDDTASVVGNAGHESSGFNKLQEISPTVAGSKGGYGWFQWTGPRRRQFEAYCKAHNLDPKTYAANYGFLKYELMGTYASVIPRVYKAVTLADKVKAFELGYEKAGVKSYAEREKWAALALQVYTPQAIVPVTPIALPIPQKPVVLTPVKPNDAKPVGLFAGIGVMLYTVWTFLTDYLPYAIVFLIGMAIFTLVVYRIKKGKWPWTTQTLTIADSQQSSPTTLPKLDQSSEQLSRRLEASLAALRATSSQQNSVQQAPIPTISQKQ